MRLTILATSLLALSLAAPAQAANNDYDFQYVPPNLHAPQSPEQPSPTTLANQLLGTQLADAITTRILLQEPNTFERDPIAKPFVRTNLGALAGVIVTNAIVRLVFHHSPQVLQAAQRVEEGAVLNNLRVISDHE